MQVFRRKWENYQTYRKLSAQWQLVQSAPVGEEETGALSSFLSAFTAAVSLHLESSFSRKAKIGQLFSYPEELHSRLSSVLQSPESPQELVEKALRALGLLLQAERRPQEDSVLLVLDLLSQEVSQSLKKLALEALQNLPNDGKKLVLREGGVERMLALLKDEELTCQVIGTLKDFLQAKPLEMAAPSLKSKITSMLGTAAKLAYTFFEEEAEILLPEPTEALPPSAAVIRNLMFPSTLETRTDDLAAILQTDGAIASILEAFTQADRLDVLETLAIFLCNNPKNKQEFRALQGFRQLEEFFDRLARTPLACDALKLLFEIVTDREKSIANLDALKVLLKLVAHPDFASQAASLCLRLLNDNWRNAVYFYMEDCFELFVVAFLTALDNFAVLESLDACARQMAYVMGHFPGLNSKVLRLYADCLTLGGQMRQNEKISQISQIREIEQDGQIEQNENYSQGATLSNDEHNEPSKYLTVGVSELDEATLALLEHGLQDFVSDLSARPYLRQAIQREAFLETYEDVQVAAQATMNCFMRGRPKGLRLVMHLVEYELRFYDILLSSNTPDLKSCLFPSDFIYQFRGGDVDAMWTYEHLLVLHHGVHNCAPALVDLCKAGELPTVLNILLLDEFPHLSRSRGVEMRRTFLEGGGLALISENLPSEEYFYLLVAACREGPALKATALEGLPGLVEQLPCTRLGVSVLFELLTASQYLTLSKFLYSIKELATYRLTESILKVQHAELLFKQRSLTTTNSTAPSSIVSTDRDPLEYLTTLELLDIPAVGALAQFLKRTSNTIQKEILVSLSYLLGNYTNKFVLSKHGFGRELLELLPTLDNSLFELACNVLFKLFSYSITSVESDLLVAQFARRQPSLLLPVLSLEAAQEFYHITGAAVQTSVVTQFPKNGYTVMFWLKARRPSEKASPLFSWVDHNKGVVCLSLSYAHCYSSLEKKGSKSRQLTDQDSCITLHAPVQAAYLSQDKYSTYSYELTKDWTHFAMVHGNKEITLYIDGRSVLVVKAVSFANSKEKLNLTGVFGNNELDALLSGVLCLEGCSEPATIQAAFSAGLSAVTDQRRQIAVVESGSLHTTSRMKEHLVEIDALDAFFSGLDSPEQPACLRFIIESICRSEVNYIHFLEKGGWSRLLDALIAAQDFLTEESVEYLLAAVVDCPHSQCRYRKTLTLRTEDIPLIARIEILPLIIQTLAPAIRPGLLASFVESLGKLMYREENSRRFLQETEGMQVFLQTAVALTDKRSTFHLLGLYERLLYCMAQEHLELLMDFLTAHSMRSALQGADEARTGMLSLLGIHMHLATNSLLEKFLAADGSTLVFELLSLDSEEARVAGLKILGLLVNRVKRFRVQFRTSGTTLLSKLLLARRQKEKNSSDTYSTLLKIALDCFDDTSRFYPRAAGDIKTILNNSQVGHKVVPNNRPAPKKIHLPEVFETIFEMLSQEDSTAVVTEVLYKIKSLLDTENCERLADSPFILWCSYIQSSDAEVRHNVKDITNTLCFFDLNRPSSCSRVFLWLQKYPESSEYQTELLNDVLGTLEHNANFETSQCQVTSHKNFLKNFFKLLSNDLPNSLHPRVMQTINHIASVNTPAVRSYMKGLGYFEKRDSLLLQSLRENLTQEQVGALIQDYSFEALASQSRFRDSFGIFYFLKFLIEASDNLPLQENLLKLLREDICVHEENRKFLRKVFDNRMFLNVMFGREYDDLPGALAACFKKRQVMLDEYQDDLPDDTDPHIFLPWLNQFETQNHVVRESIQKHLLVYEGELKKTNSKAQEARALKKKKTVDTLARDKANLLKTVNEFENKINSRVAKSEENTLERFGALATNK